MERAGAGCACRRVISGMDRGEPAAMAVQDEAGDPVRAPGCDRLEQDEVAGGVAGGPPGNERLSRTERELPALPRLEQEVVEVVEGGRGRCDGWLEPLPCPAGPAP